MRTDAELDAHLALVDRLRVDLARDVKMSVAARKFSRAPHLGQRMALKNALMVCDWEQTAQRIDVEYGADNETVPDLDITVHGLLLAATRPECLPPKRDRLKRAAVEAMTLRALLQQDAEVTP